MQSLIQTLMDFLAKARAQPEPQPYFRPFPYPEVAVGTLMYHKDTLDLAHSLRAQSDTS